MYLYASIYTHEPIEFQRFILKFLKPVFTSFQCKLGRGVSFLILWLFDCLTFTFCLNSVLDLVFDDFLESIINFLALTPTQIN